MATERDVYQVDTQEAISSLQALGRAYLALSSEVDKNKEKTETLASVMKDNLAASFLTAQAQFALLQKAFHAIIDTIGEGIKEWEESANASARLGVILRNTGADVEFYTRKFEAQQKQVEKNLGIDEAYVANLQTVILTMGVSAEETERFANASIKLSKLMGSDAVSAARLLAKAQGEGKDELRKFGIQLDDVIEQGGGFAGVLAEVEKRTAGVTDSMTEYTRLTNAQAAAWGDVKKAAGGFFAEMFVFLNRDAIKMDAMLEKIRNVMLDARMMEIRSIYKQHGYELGKNDGLDEFSVGDITDVSKQMEEKAKKQEEALMKRLKKMGQLYSEERSLRDENEKEQNEHDRKAVAEAQKMMDEADNDRIAREKHVDEIITDVQREAAEKEAQLYKELRENQAKADADALEKNAKFWNDMIDQGRNAAQQLVSMTVNFLGDLLLENTQFNREMFELQVQRETVGMAETEALAKRAEMEGEMRDSKIASFEKEVAASLISIAKDATVKALFEGAEAIASAAIYDYAGAEQHGIAALMYAGVAVAAGGAGYAMSSNRGMTTDEKSRLEDAKKAKTDREKRDKDRAATASTEMATQVTVVYMGIAGTTELEQARELERIQGEYGKLKTGSK